MGFADVKFCKRLSSPSQTLRRWKHLVKDRVCKAHLLGIASFALCGVTLLRLSYG